MLFASQIRFVGARSFPSSEMLRIVEWHTLIDVSRERVAFVFGVKLFKKRKGKGHPMACLCRYREKAEV